VLIVFSLLITRPKDEAEEIARRPKSLIPGLACTLPVLAVLVYVAIYGTSIKIDGSPKSFTVSDLGEVLFTTHTPAVLAVAVLLTAVMIGAALFAREPGKKSNELSD